MKTIKTQNVSIPVELHDWVTKKMEETKLSTPWAKVTFSSVVEHALIELRNSEAQISAQKSPSKPSNVSSRVNAKVVKGSESSVGGFSKATTDRSRKTG
jgi:SH3-like domain-containing protein